MPDSDHIIVLHGVTWEDYERILEIRGERSAPRISYLEGELEIISPGTSFTPPASVLCSGGTGRPEAGAPFVGYATAMDLSQKEDAKGVMKPAGQYTFEDIHRALFPKPPKPRTLEELKEGVAEYIREKYARR